MSSYVISAMNFYDEFTDLVKDQSEWSQATFGLDIHRGPLGALKHLEKEAIEAQEVAGMDTLNQLQEELADCFLLLLDANRRSGFSPLQLVRAAQKKMAVNKTRTWPTPVDDTPVEHVR
jgi:hypothetical protein